MNSLSNQSKNVSDCFPQYDNTVRTKPDEFASTNDHHTPTTHHLISGTATMNDRTETLKLS